MSSLMWPEVQKTYAEEEEISGINEGNKVGRQNPKSLWHLKDYSWSLKTSRAMNDLLKVNL